MSFQKRNVVFSQGIDVILLPFERVIRSHDSKSFDE